MSRVLFLLFFLVATVPTLAGTDGRGLGLLFRNPSKDPHGRQVKTLADVESAKDGELPSSYDNTAYLPPVDSQGGQGSCVAWAVGYYMRAEMENFALGRTDPAQRAMDCNRFSPAFLYNMIHVSGDNGAYYSDAFQVLATLGCSSWAALPYTDGNYSKWPSEAAFMESMRYRTTANGDDYYWKKIMGNSDIDDIKRLVVAGTAPIVSIFVYPPYNSLDETNDDYTITDGHSGDLGGGHAQCIVGYDDNHESSDGMGAFLVVNSWGEDWGNHGFYWLSYNAVKYHDTNHDGTVDEDDAAITTGRIYWVDRRMYQSAQYLAKFNIRHSASRSIEIQLAHGDATIQLLDLYVKLRGQRDYQAFTDSYFVVDVDDLFTETTKDSLPLQLNIRDTVVDEASGEVEDFQFIGPEGVAGCPDVPVAIPQTPGVYGTVEVNPADCLSSKGDVPEFASWQGGAAYLDLAVRGNTAYCVSDGSMDVVDCTDPAQPIRTGQYSALGLSYGVDVFGTTAAIADYSYGLRLLDVSNSGNIQLVGELPISGANPYKVAIDGDVAYVALIRGGFVIADISDPEHPIQKSRVNLDYAYDVKEKDNLLYVADGYSGLSIYDVSDSEAPFVVGTLATHGFVRAVALSGTNAVIGDSNKGLMIIDLSDPAQPTSTGVIGLAGTPFRVWVEGAIAYVAEGGDGIEVFDVTDPAAIIKTATIPAADYARGVARNGSTLYVADRNAGLSLINVQDNAAPASLGSYRGFEPGLVFSADSKALVTGNVGNEARFFSTKADGAIEPGGAIYPGEAVTDSTGGETYFLLIAGSNDLLTVNSEDINHPVWKGTLTFSGITLNHVIASGTRAFVTASDGVHVVNLADLDHPVESGSFSINGADRLCEQDGILAVSSIGDNNIHILSIATPDSPVELSTISIGNVEGLWFDHGNLIVNCGAEGLKCVDLNNPLQPGEILILSNISVAAMDVFDGTAYLLDSDHNLNQIDIRVPSSPVATGDQFFLDADSIAATSSYLVVSSPDSSSLSLLPLVRNFAIPHVAESNWTTKVVLYNENPYDIGIRLSKWGNSANSEITNGVFRVPANASLALSDDDFGPEGTAEVMACALNLKAKLSYRYGQSHSLCEFFVEPGALADRYMLANTYREWFDWFGLVVSNGGERVAHVSLSAWKGGILKGVRENVEIAPHTKYVDVCQNIWDGVNYADIDMVTIDSDIPIEPPISITGNTAQDRHVFFSAKPLAQSNGDNTLYLAHIPEGNWHTILTLYNTTETAKEITLTQWDDNGVAVVNGTTHNVSSMDKLVLTTDSGDLQAQGLGKIVAENGVVAKLSYQYKDSHSFCEFFLDRDKTAKKWMLTNSIQDFFQWFGVAISNPTDSTVNMTMKALKDGVVVGVTSFSISAHSKKVGVASDFWDGLAYDGLDTVIVESDQAIPAPISITGNTAQNRHVFFNASSMN